MVKTNIKRLTDGAEPTIKTSPFVENILGDVQEEPAAIPSGIGKGRGGKMPVRNKKVKVVETPIEIQGSHGEPFGEPILPATVQGPPPPQTIVGGNGPSAPPMTTPPTLVTPSSSSVSKVTIPKIDVSSKVYPCPLFASSRISKMQTIKLGNAVGDVSAAWGSRFDPKQCSIFLHRVSVTSNPTGHLSAPIFESSGPQNVKFRIIRDNNLTPLPEGSIYLGSYSDVHVGPAMQTLHVFLLP